MPVHYQRLNHLIRLYTELALETANIICVASQVEGICARGDTPDGI